LFAEVERLKALSKPLIWKLIYVPGNDKKDAHISISNI